MNRLFSQALLIAMALPAICLAQQNLQPGTPTTDDSNRSVEEIRAVLDAIHPYLPKNEVSSEVVISGSTSMDSLAHGWSLGFEKFHPGTKVKISTQGSETVFAALAKNPAGIGMISRPVTQEDMEKLQNAGLKRPVAIMIAREALGVFVHESNPLESVDFPQLLTIFCGDGANPTINWQSVGVTGGMADKPIQIIGRESNSGTQTFVENFLFQNHKLRPLNSTVESNTQLIKAIESNPAAIAISGLKCGGHAAKPLHLRDDKTLLPNTDHAILVGQYPLTRPLTLVIDLGQDSEQAIASREFVRYALSQAGQMQAILSGFFPFDPPTLRAEEDKLNRLTMPTNELETAGRPTPAKK